ncbi:hypothetical protein BBI01_00155 [Chryseobacterium artocarpi]|uniref:DUF7738 domain-containing protein n=1 Tax=Chryseobacterium artocarpi TaxID=1414727 RepID=A0A1B8ZZC8_9FLAO|nr:hypothetical protein [Chryseobacterium artocarpi]OCA76914.1 hypothetical protein BBI01_00155 [Chryseobacterium artocarpi]
MLKKINNLILLIIIMTQTISCQEKANKNNNSFQIDKKEIFYNDKKIHLGMPIEEFAKIVNSEYRVAKYSIPERTDKVWTWKDGGEAYVNDSGKIKYYNVNTNDDSLEKEYNSIEELVKKVGNYENFKEEKVSGQEQIFYVWDKLGFNVAVHDNTVGQINLYPIAFTKRETEYKLRVPGPPMPQSDDYILTDDKTDVENYQVMLERQPKTEFKGTFSYDGNTADFAKIGYTDYNKMVKDLHIEGSSYDPPGDSKGWGRKIWLNYDNCLIDIRRYNNDGKTIKDKVGKIDGVLSIEIWRFTDEDRK